MDGKPSVQLSTLVMATVDDSQDCDPLQSAAPLQVDPPGTTNDSPSPPPVPSLPRSASYTYLPSAPRPRTQSDASPSTSRTRSRRNKSRRRSEDAQAIRISNFVPKNVAQPPDTSYQPTPEAKPSKEPPHISRSVSENFASFALKSWVSSSRSPSPHNRKRERSARPEIPSAHKKVVPAPGKQNLDASPERLGYAKPTNYSIRGMSLRGSTLLRKSKRSFDPLQKQIDVEEIRSVSPPLSIPRSISSDRLSSLAKIFASERISPISRNSSSEKLHTSSRDVGRKKDELWTAFRGLDQDFQKFQSKSSALKANVVRSSLVPFLTTYAEHPSNKRLRPEDLDRRVTIFNRWWTGLLDMLNGTHQTLSGTDRPVLLDGIVGIMARPEWRQAPSPFAPLELQLSHHCRPISKTSRSPSSTSLASSASDFITESIHHNIKNIFIHNLLTQTALVIDKLCLKAAPASLVSFGGKALAYAFFFCPGLAEVLVRLWAIPVDSIRRVSREFDLDESQLLSETSENIASGFPDHLRDLAFTSYACTVKTLRRRPALPLGAGKINWYGPWIGRWRGRDSDLFFGFVKQWHMLLNDFFLPRATISEKACSPAFVLVHAQILTLVDSTIYRQQSHSLEAKPGSSPLTFDDVLADPNTSAAALQLPSTNVTRLMAENRLIMLLREILSERSSASETVRHTFAEAFANLLQTAARRISVFNHNACFTLCDFLEESATILLRYERASGLGKGVVDWTFWLTVCKQMTASQNTMSELRLFSFLYSIWSPIVADESRKEGLCLDWLLDETTFNTYFLHWCPVIRAYYMRLLCWRIARCDGEASELDMYVANLPSDKQPRTDSHHSTILETLSVRLGRVWAQFLRDSAAAQARHATAPSTAPCSPAPGRRLLIVRNDTQVDPNLLSNFGALNQPSPSDSQPGNTRRISINPLAETGIGRANARASSAPNPEQGAKKRWTLLRNIRSFSGTSSHGPKSKSEEEISSNPAQRDSGSLSPVESPTSPNGSQGGANLDIHHSFRFSLEWHDRPHTMGKDRKLHAPVLPSPARQVLDTRGPGARKAGLQAAEARRMENCNTPGGTYGGRALAEWSLVVMECQTFFERRRAEGVQSDAYVETPTLGMDAFRK